MIDQIGRTLHFIFGGDFPDDPLLLHQAMALIVLTGATLHAARTLSARPLEDAAKMQGDGTFRSARDHL